MAQPCMCSQRPTTPPIPRATTSRSRCALDSSFPNPSSNDCQRPMTPLTLRATTLRARCVWNGSLPKPLFQLILATYGPNSPRQQVREVRLRLSIPHPLSQLYTDYQYKHLSCEAARVNSLGCLMTCHTGVSGKQSRNARYIWSKRCITQATWKGPSWGGGSLSWVIACQCFLRSPNTSHVLYPFAEY